MTSKQAIEISDQIQRAKNRYYKAIERAGTGITDPQEIDRIISEVIEADKDVQAALKRWRELSKIVTKPAPSVPRSWHEF